MSPTYTVVGTPFSTFTRSITLGLTHKNLPFKQTSTLPRSDLARQHHPLGFIPTLIIHTTDGEGNEIDIKLRESQAIARFIDRIASDQPSLNVHEQGTTSFTESIEHARVWEFVSLVASSGFPAIEVGVVKPRLSAMIEGRLNAEAMDALTVPGIPAMKRFFQVAESLVRKDTLYLFAEHPTWADFFLYPLLADLKAIPQWSVVESDRIKNWMQAMEELPAARSTHAGTLLAGAFP